ncbi:hypothetical protein BX666DRAFT_1833575, partial [Dichotomocladium elegans]
LITPLIAHMPTTTSYLPAQYRFLCWCQHYDRDPTQFNATDIINFLSLACDTGFQLNTIKLYRSAILVFHSDAESIRSSLDLLEIFRRWARAAPPRPWSRPVVDVTPTLRFLASIASLPTTTISLLNQKTAFLLAMAAFLWPSDLHCIQLQHCSVSTDNLLTLSILAPKETCCGQRIIKTLVVHPLAADSALCPVQAFVALRDHLDAANRLPDVLFVNSHSRSSPLSATTIAAWLKRLLACSLTSADSRPTLSVRSIASDLTLQRGVSLDDVVTMGNWSSTTVFDQHYRRSRMVRSNMSRHVLEPP